MKDMERWAKIQNRQKDSVRAASPVLKSGLDDERKQSKSADAGFAIFERKVREPGGKDPFQSTPVSCFPPCLHTECVDVDFVPFSFFLSLDFWCR